jgi:MFS family permease
MILYLAGIFMGAIDTGIVTPARTIIQNSLGVDAATGIWMITIYTLAYAASIPSWEAGRQIAGNTYPGHIFLFGLGSLFCGLSSISAAFPAACRPRGAGHRRRRICRSHGGVRHHFPPKSGMALGCGRVYGLPTSSAHPPAAPSLIFSGRVTGCSFLRQ